MNGLQSAPLQTPGLLQRLLRRKPRENAFLEVRNLLAETPIHELRPEQVHAILDEYGIGAEDAAPHLQRLYGMVMRHAVRDGEITNDEIAELGHLRHVFGFSDRDVADIEEAMIEDAYRTHMRAAIGDARLTDEEKRRLQELAGRLRIPEATARAIREEEISRVYDRVFRAAIVDRRLSDEEERYLAELAHNLGHPVRHDRGTLRDLDHFRLLWRIEQGELPELDTSLHLAKGEHVHARCPGRAWVSRSEPRGRRVRLGRVIDWRLGEEALAEGREREWQGGDEGTLSITNQRVVFEREGGVVEVEMASILRFTAWKDALQLDLESDPARLFVIDGDTEIVGTILGVFVKANR